MQAMINYPNISPIAFHLGPIAVHWYGLMYLVGFLLAWLLGCYRAKRSNGVWTTDQVSDVIVYAALGVIIGGRLGYMLFYDLPQLLSHPTFLFKVWDGGMSFHGGMLGAIIAVWLFARRHKKNVWDITDFVAPLVPLGLMAGRIGNFINGELWGRVSTVPWAMVFPTGGPLPRHPSQLYEAALEGLLLFIILWIFSIKKRPRFAVSALFLLCYGIFRFFVEFYRVPDAQYGYLAFGWVTMGQILSVPMMVIGALSLCYIYFGSNKTMQGVEHD
jgi:phosphatidylglycerol:prolipoprotein diacylglycerol transferase